MEYTTSVDQEIRHLVNGEDRDMPPPCQVLQECQHLPFPEPTSQRPEWLPSLNGKSPSYLALSRRSYGATPLLNFTCDNFYKCEEELRSEQILARNSFIEIFLSALDQSSIWENFTPEEIEAFEQDCGSFNVKSKVFGLDKSLHEMMDHLDDFFFFGALTRVRYEPPTLLQRSPLLKLETGFNTFKGKVTDLYGYQTNYEGADGLASRIVVYTKRFVTSLEAKQDASNIPFKDIVQTLIHEMLHAYLAMFVCERPQSLRNLLNTVGLTGHGPTFMKLQTLITETVRTWHPSLKDMNRDGCRADTAFDTFDHDEEQRAIKEAASKGLLRGFYRLKKDSGHERVQIIGEKLSGGKYKYSVIYRPAASNYRQQNHRQQIDPDADFVDDENDGGYDDSEEYEEDEDDEMNDL
ncbi:hypothetical protein CSIM01_00178 [Colletotrichum simmondsii]|uniref:SprT-like domain-containing protein n=1 Tax=Colletotrichum simmondsii TaxID=703756 RepID=A0A135SML1_9PEZI|nr:hypothetical protein CSIM01_00178 [Colletotrichum simmondsii]